MSTPNNADRVVDTKPLDLATHIDKLESEGIVSSSRGPRGSLWNMPQLPPDTLKRFLEREYRDFPPGEQK